MSNYLARHHRYTSSGYVFDSGGAQALDGSDAASWSPLYCSVAAQSYPAGTAVLITTTAGDGSHAATTSKTFTTVDMSRMPQTLSLWLWWDPSNPSTTTAIQFSLGDYSNYWSYDFDRGRLQPGWNKIVIAGTQFTVAGSPSWSSVKQFRTRLMAGSGEVYRYAIRDVRLGEYCRPVVQVQFDDCVATMYANGWPLVQASGLPVTLHCISSLIGTGGYMTLAQVKEIYAAGHDVANHTADHLNLGSADYDTARYQIRTGQDFLSANGMTRGECHRHVAWPYGVASAAAQKAAADLGVRTARRVYGNAAPHPLGDGRLMTQCYNIANTTTLGNVQAVVNAAIAIGGVVRLLMHKIVNSPAASDEWSTANLQTLLTWLRGLRDGGVIAVMTESQWHDGLSA